MIGDVSHQPEPEKNRPVITKFRVAVPDWSWSFRPNQEIERDRLVSRQEIKRLFHDELEALGAWCGRHKGPVKK